MTATSSALRTDLIVQQESTPPTPEFLLHDQVRADSQTLHSTISGTACAWMA